MTTPWVLCSPSIPIDAGVACNSVSAPEYLVRWSLTSPGTGVSQQLSAISHLDSAPPRTCWEIARRVRPSSPSLENCIPREIVFRLLVSLLEALASIDS